MTFNVKKCKLVGITQKKKPLTSNMTLNGSVLEATDELCDLVLLTNHHRSWNFGHIDTIARKANRILDLTRRTSRD